MLACGNAMFKVLDTLLRRIVRNGDLVFIDCDGNAHSFGDGEGRRLTVRLADARVERQLAINPELRLGEAYMDGRLTIEGGRVYDLLELLLANMQRLGTPRWVQVLENARKLKKRVQQFNPAPRARRNAAHHYDIKREFYDLFLDRDWQYSCAYFTDGADLDEAQLAKKRHLTAKLAVNSGQRVLDIGSGWGGLALYLAKIADCEVTGVTLSQEQLQVSRERARKQGLARAVRFELQDYRKVQGTFDRIVSVGMFEHVGVNHYGQYFRKVRELLADNGVALVHTIGRSDVPTITNPFIARYIFPGGYIPSLSEIVPHIERAGFFITDVEVLRLHYAKTLRAWRERFLANWDKATALMGDRFCRMWEFYLAGSEAAFRYQGLVVFQLQLARKVDTLPLTRDYIADAERRLRAIEEYAEAPRLAGE